MGYLKAPSVIPITTGGTYVSHTNDSISREVIDIERIEPRPLGPRDLVRVTYRNQKGEIRECGLRNFLDWAGLEI